MEVLMSHLKKDVSKRAIRKVAAWLKSPAGRKKSKEVFEETEQAIKEYRMRLLYDPIAAQAPKSI